jgi:apolipoprotein N-acyltransferase
MIAKFILSLFIVAFGQPVWSSLLSIIAATCGYALFFQVLLCQKNAKQRFLLAFCWYTAVEWIQLSWFLSHPYLYILAVHLLLSAMGGVQFGLFALFIKEENIRRIKDVLALCSLWVIMEWARLFFLAGFAFNPAGLALGSNLYSMQLASVFGVFGLTFWVFFVNILALRKTKALFVMAALFPFIFGALHLAYHEKQVEGSKTFDVLLVQTAFAPGETLAINTMQQMLEHTLSEWKQIVGILKEHLPKKVDLIVFPEGTVPFGTYNFAYSLDQAKELLAGATLPPLDFPFAYQQKDQWFVNNAYIAKSIGNLFDAPVVIGLEDAERCRGGVESYTSAQYICDTGVCRYEKQVLVPMGEYIPFQFCQKMAASYGVAGSFTHGKGAKVMEHEKAPFGLSICYEEMFSDLMRQNKKLGSHLLVNITNDAWYPNSTLPKQHFDHARLRTVENGFPLVRSCNTGVTAAVDSLGRVIAHLGEKELGDSEWKSAALFASVPLYTYWTPYSQFGDGLIIGFSFISILLFFRRLNLKR